MGLISFFHAVRTYIRDEGNALHSNNEKLLFRIADVFARTWDLGFTAFGGPPVHFQIIHQRFVESRNGKSPWIDEQTVSDSHLMSEIDNFKYQELFAVCQALPGPASTKMLFCIAILHAGFIPALIVFFLWRYMSRC